MDQEKGLSLRNRPFENPQVVNRTRREAETRRIFLEDRFFRGPGPDETFEGQALMKLSGDKYVLRQGVK